MAISIVKFLSGTRQALDAIRLTDANTRARVRDAIQVTTERVTTRAISLVPVSGPQSRKAKSRPGPGELRDTVRSAFSTSGLSAFVMVGFGKLPRRSRRRAKYGPKLGPLTPKQHAVAQKRAALRQIRSQGVYAMVINYGSPGRGIAGSHFLNRALEAERVAHIRRIEQALAGGGP